MGRGKKAADAKAVLFKRLYGKGETVAVSYSVSGGSRSMYLGTDVLGSVRSAMVDTGLIEERYEYDAFGTPYQGDFSSGMNLGYTGKPVEGFALEHITVKFSISETGQVFSAGYVNAVGERGGINLSAGIYTHREIKPDGIINFLSNELPVE
jgi:hypothetical protein